MSGAPVRTTCPYCGVGCGILATPDGNGGVAIEGDPEHPANFGRLCSKGAALGETVGLEGRLLHPEIGGRRVDWETALDAVASTFARTMAEHGPDAVAFYVSGQLLTEDYYVANKLMKGFIGSANIDTNSRLCMASSVAGHKRAFGSDTVPGTYRDLELADLIMLVGSNLAWCHPVLYQRIAAAKAERPEMRIVVIDPRETATTEIADLHLNLAPDSDVALFLGLLDHLGETGCLDQSFVAMHTSGCAEALRAAKDFGIEGAVRETGVSREILERFYRLFAETERAVTVYSQGVNQSAYGTDKVNAIINCHLLTGRIGRPGMGPFSVTGQPNAMGGREVGGLANQLACHMELENPAHRAIVRAFWRSPNVAHRPGLKAVELFEAVADGRVKALWIMGTNPAVSMPDADGVAEALARCPFVVVSDVVRDTDTTRLADVLLPAAAWGEKSGTVTNSERRISRQRAFLALPGEARPDWWILQEVARRMGHASAFAYRSPAEIFREFAALSAAGNEGSRDFDIGGLAELSEPAYDVLPPIQWPVQRTAARGPWDSRFFAGGGFFTEDGKARMVPTPLRPALVPKKVGPTLVLNTGRVRDHWHTMTRTGLSPRLSRHIAEPYCEIHPDDAARLGIAPASLVEISGARGRAVLRALITERQQPGSVFAPMHWTGRTSSGGRIGGVIAPARDAVSGQPALKSSTVMVRPFDAAWFGYAVLRERPAEIAAEYWVVARAEGGWRIELAGRSAPDDWSAFAQRLFGLDAADAGSLISLSDPVAGHARFACFAGSRLRAALFAGPSPVSVSRAWLADHLTHLPIADADRARLLAGRAGGNRPDPGPTICSCFNVGANQIASAISEGGCTSLEEIGAALGAGTNCGSCRSEIQRILGGVAIREAI
jgi:assimilatory nitrate reductase catalytic subunit